MGGLNTLSDWLNYQDNLHFKKIDLGLERVTKVYKKLFPKGILFQVITVAGTNGKGSTVAFIDSIYQQSNFKVGKFSSPHILKYNERFVINGIQATDEKICSAFNKIEQIREKTSLTYFEFSTLAALIIFELEKVDVAVLEVGIGGRLDSVNIVDNNVGVITNIDIDHVDYLGNTRELIGYEKAGIMRKNTPCICADINPPTSINQYAHQIKAQLEFVKQRYTGDIGLISKHQQQNAATAILTVQKLNKTLPINANEIKRGIKYVKLNARFQIETIHNKTFIFDVAHNVAAVKVLSAELAKQKCPTIAIFSALKDKNIGLMINKISMVINQWLLVPLNVNRAISMQTLSKQFNLAHNIQICNDMQDAINHGINDKQYRRIVIFGSFYVVANALKILTPFMKNNKE
ncbi:bifunctional folylpolyglutamate synthase/dihydrofolate synthase [Candidatus Vesicomyidisocius calyptogenae]|uniref:Dihydrofolate synthase/folylpolyglutamate synthase n=1 Tax=Vesicomyosocius okutanii subsp. Calyptogena okutanii (strain HA) TaxID=412965 RepID=A5CVL0_VESOH|nr:folylpolyglutamate synthase/dihydrofolate synthase family protein [Candidatus Vesicomyosocius okutanii]BAF61999.1 bifunctional folate biosynthesis protein FolC [Candidatus Vesicomyosocius okutanii]